MRLVLLSDTHGRHNEIVVPDGDVLIHAGDFSRFGDVADVGRFARWLGDLPHENKLVIAGNHDRLLEDDPYVGRAMLIGRGIDYLQDNGVEIGGRLFYGSPWQPEFCDWAFNLPRGGKELRREWSRIPDDTDVLITHGPPMSVLDRTEAGEPVGCEELYARVSDMPDLELHVFGHIHEGGGQQERIQNTLFVNAAVCDVHYRAVNAPVVIDLE